jgi:hypothetical protein
MRASDEPSHLSVIVAKRPREGRYQDIDRYHSPIVLHQVWWPNRNSSEGEVSLTPIRIEGEMSQLQTEAISEASKTELPVCARLITLAQRELAAFLSAVVSLFGSEQAALAADAWIAELTSLESVMGFGSRDWRLVTVGAVSRLAHHLANIRKIRKSCVVDLYENSVETVVSTRLGRSRDTDAARGFAIRYQSTIDR